MLGDLICNESKQDLKDFFRLFRENYYNNGIKIIAIVV